MATDCREERGGGCGENGLDRIGARRKRGGTPAVYRRRRTEGASCVCAGHAAGRRGTRATETSRGVEFATEACSYAVRRSREARRGSGRSPCDSPCTVLWALGRHRPSLVGAPAIATRITGCTGVGREACISSEISRMIVGPCTDPDLDQVQVAPPQADEVPAMGQPETAMRRDTVVAPKT